MSERMTKNEALEHARRIAAYRGNVTPGEQAAVTLAVEVIATEEAITDAVSTWQQYRDNPHIPPEVRRAFDALAARR